MIAVDGTLAKATISRLRVPDMTQRRYVLWPQLLVIGLIATLLGLVLAAVNYPQWGGGLAGGAAFLMAAAAGQRFGPGLTRGDPPPQIVDPGRTPPMQRGA
jgi:hypothetical protein